MRLRTPVLLSVLALLLAGATTASAGSTRVTRAAAPMGLVSGPDVSSHQHARGAGIHWGKVSSGGRGFAVVKATEGGGYTNPYFAQDWNGMRAAGLYRAAYHYARPSRAGGSAVQQARRLVAAVPGQSSPLTLPLVLDMEETGGLRPAELQAWTAQFLSTVEQTTGRTPIVYTYPYFWRVAMGNSTAFTHYPLWIASYAPAPPNPLPGGWPSWTLWQYTANGHMAGVQGVVDLSVFCCSPAALAQLATAGSSPVTERWAALGGAAGALGAPASPEISAAGGRFRDFTGGSIYWSPATGAQVLTGPVLARYRGLGGPRSGLGWPTTDSLPVDGVPGATYAVLSGGRLYAGPGDGAAWLLPNGPVLDGWLQRGSVAGPLGLPVADVTALPDGLQGTFAGGVVTASAERGVHELHGGVLATWQSYGGAYSAYGLPSSDVHPVPGGEQAEFGMLVIVAPTGS